MTAILEDVYPRAEMLASRRGMISSAYRMISGWGGSNPIVRASSLNGVTWLTNNAGRDLSCNLLLDIVSVATFLQQREGSSRSKADVYVQKRTSCTEETQLSTKSL